MKHRNRVMLAMLSIAEVEVGKDKFETLNLLRMQAIQWHRPVCPAGWRAYPISC